MPVGRSPSFGDITRASKKWFNPNVTQYPHDVAKARALLREIGIEDRNGDGAPEDGEGNPIEFVSNTNTGNNTRDKVAVLVQSDLKKLGLRVTYQPIEFNTLILTRSTTPTTTSVLLSEYWRRQHGSRLQLERPPGPERFHPSMVPGAQKRPAPSARRDIDSHERPGQDAGLCGAEENVRRNPGDPGRASSDLLILAPFSFAAIRSNVGNVRGTPLSYYRLTWNAEELYFKKK